MRYVGIKDDLGISMMLDEHVERYGGSYEVVWEGEYSTWEQAMQAWYTFNGFGQHDPMSRL